MDVFELHRHVIADYSAYTGSFVRIADQRIRSKVDAALQDGLLWPEPLLQLNPAYEPGKWIEQLVDDGLLHADCARIFRAKRNDADFGKPMRLHLHQEQAIHIASQNRPYVLTTGTGSGKSLSYIVPIVNHVLRRGSGQGIQAIVVYPMNALANSQQEELDKFLKNGFAGAEPLVTYHRYTGQENEETRERIRRQPPDILLTNYVMLELILTRIEEVPLVRSSQGLKFLVFDELHTYRGRQGADVAMLIRRCRDAFNSTEMLCVGTSATMASEGTSTEQTKLVADVATRIFGQTIQQSDVIGETLKPNAAEFDFSSPAVIQSLREAISPESIIPRDFSSFANTAMASWIERRFGIRREAETGKYVRQTPTPLTGEKGSGSLALAELIGCTQDEAANAIRRWLDEGTKQELENPETGFRFFAFRLHQFITRGDTAWTSIEPISTREIQLRGQKFVPGDRSRILLPMVFCRSCGQEYYRVNRFSDRIEGRSDFTLSSDDGIASGYLYYSEESPWPEDDGGVLARVPAEWVEEHRGALRLKRSAPEPEIISVTSQGDIAGEGLRVAFVPAPFRFCLNPKCGVSHNSRQRSDISKLATIGTDGRSTATTVLALSTILKIKSDPSLVTRPEAKKLLSFTDNRQDASLQAGHFNDFVEVSLVRSALYRAMNRVGAAGLKYDDLVHHVAAALDLPLELYSNEPELRGAALDETKRAFRAVLSYFLYRDLERGWRITSPNLEQCGLLKIDYLNIGELAADDEFWSGPTKNSRTGLPEFAHPALAKATAQQREHVIRVLLDHLRRSLAIREDSLTAAYQDRISEQSRQRLCEPWTIEDARDMVVAGTAWPRSIDDGEFRGDLFLSPQSNFGLFLRRPGTLPGPLTIADTKTIIEDLFKRLHRPWGLLAEVKEPIGGTSVSGYQVPSSVMVWKAGEGTAPGVDHLRTTQTTAAEDQSNQYFVSLYKSFAERGPGLEAREHTAQVPADIREDREKQFRAGDLDILFCSPTMELGVDISQLNVVNMRNVPPTPANYAQRSGRAGRSGQTAFVYTYCSGFSPHDQYYFNRPERMVAGAVTAPRVDLLNQDMIRSHVHAIWLTSAGLKLGKTLAEILVVSEEDLSLPIREEIREKLTNSQLRLKALQRAKSVLSSLGSGLTSAYWYRDTWLDDILLQIPKAFDAACDRWRSLYRAAVQQRYLQNRILGDHTRQQLDKERAKRLRAQAEDQINLLTDSQSAIESDFYSYRYFASEGFLPGYNFPRLPLSAFVPGRRGRRGRNEFLSRARFLAISEFGPRAIVYHEGARYRVNKVNLAFDEGNQELTEYVMKRCSECGGGYLEPVDTCVNCGLPFSAIDEVRSLVRLQNVTLKRADQITSDEEERQRVGYDIQTSYRFSEVAGVVDVRKAEIVLDGQAIATLCYGDAAQIWRVNRGWRRRNRESELGFQLDLERGYWASNREEIENGDREDPQSPRVRRVVPFVEDHRNVLTINFGKSLSTRAGSQELHNKLMATVQAAIKQAIQQVYQLEPGELAAEPLPDSSNRKLLFFFESSEGGAGVLRQLVDDPSALPRIARAALEICHFDSQDGQDLARELGVQCEAACYDCLLEYGNQTEHNLIDRHLIVELLMQLVKSITRPSSDRLSRDEKFDELLKQCDSDLERDWLRLLQSTNRSLPSHSQFLIKSANTRPDFFYADKRTAIYIDGPIHEMQGTAEADTEVQKRLDYAGIKWIRFSHNDDWEKILNEYPDIFGKRF